MITFVFQVKIQSHVVKYFKSIAYNPTSLTIFLGTLLLVWQELQGGLSIWVQIFFAFGFVFFIGIPHRTLDIWLEQEQFRRAGKVYKKWTFYVRYLLAIILFGLLWWYWPTGSVFLFLIVTAWHVGESDLKSLQANNLIWTLTRYSYGIMIVLWLFLGHGSQTSILWASITRQDMLMMQIWLILIASKGLIIGGVCLITFVLLLLAQYKNPSVFTVRKIIALVIILVLCEYLPLLPALALYFGGWHAVNAFSDAHRYFLPEGRSTNSAFQLWLHAMPITLVAVVMTLGYAYFWAAFAKSMNPIPVMYLLVMCTTFPHQWLIGQINRDRNS
ncbi:Brp/Blh family beta-carotene 15,15'-dioxygenase [Flectobacillus sp.]|uniref:Brp/Blh family beta-carotene 15,15'-dioxygenase n=1 Tax=Flectobacillus sp. TaxID=50419 RepID=UPI003BA92597